MDIDEDSILAFKDMVDKRVLRFFRRDDDSEIVLDEKSLNDWMSAHGIRRFRHEWVCVQFLDTNHLMVLVTVLSEGTGTCLLFPKDFVTKSLVLGNIP